MGKLITELVNYNLISDWANALDWLLSNDRFAEKRGWDKNKKGKFTRLAKKMMSLPKENCIYASSKHFSFDDISKKRNGTHPYYIAILETKSFSVDLVRHIRNGIAHGNAKIKSVRGELHIEICDYKDSTLKNQSAYIYLPLSCIPKLHKIYETIESQPWKIRTSNNSSRKKTA